MKKYTLAMVVAAAGLAMPLAASAGTINAATSLGSAAFAPSKNVTINTLSAATAYAAISGHTQGLEQYGILSSDTNIYYKSVSANTSVPAPTSTTALGNSLTNIK